MKAWNFVLEVQIWSSVLENVCSLIQRSESEIKLKSVPKEVSVSVNRTKASIKLALQALTMSARHVLILVSFEELQKCVICDPETSNGTVSEEEVLEMVVDTFKATGKRWLGYEPIYRPNLNPTKFMACSRAL